MGVFIDALNNSDSEYIRAVEQIKDIISRRTRMPFHHPDIIFNNTSTGRACNKLIAKTHEFTHKVRLWVNTINVGYEEALHVYKHEFWVYNQGAVSTLLIKIDKFSNLQYGTHYMYV